MTDATKDFIENNKVSETYLYDWYISSVDDEEPVWTATHIKDLMEDFELIPREVVLQSDFAIEMEMGEYDVDERTVKEWYQTTDRYQRDKEYGYWTDGHVEELYNDFFIFDKNKKELEGILQPLKGDEILSSIAVRYGEHYIRIRKVSTVFCYQIYKSDYSLYKKGRCKAKETDNLMLALKEIIDDPYNEFKTKDIGLIEFVNEGSLLNRAALVSASEV